MIGTIFVAVSLTLAGPFPVQVIGEARAITAELSARGVLLDLENARRDQGNVRAVNRAHIEHVRTEYLSESVGEREYNRDGGVGTIRRREASTFGESDADAHVHARGGGGMPVAGTVPKNTNV